MSDELEQQAERQDAEDTRDTGSDQDKTATRTFTQDELNAIINDRLARERNKYSDYDDLKKAATQLQEIEDAQKSEAEKLQEALAQAQQEREQLLEARKRDRIEMAVLTAAQKANWRDPQDAMRLIDTSVLEVSDEGVKGVEDQLKALAEKKPYLLREAEGRMSPTALGRGQAAGESRADRLARLAGTSNRGVLGSSETGGLILHS